MWFHVDGAFGAWVKISRTHQHLVNGMERADFLAVDLHKWMNMPYGIGCTMVKDRLAHFSAFVYGHEAEYLKSAFGVTEDKLTNPQIWHFRFQGILAVSKRTCSCEPSGKRNTVP